MLKTALPVTAVLWHTYAECQAEAQIGMAGAAEELARRDRLNADNPARSAGLAPLKLKSASELPDVEDENLSSYGIYCIGTGRITSGVGNVLELLQTHEVTGPGRRCRR